MNVEHIAAEPKMNTGEPPRGRMGKVVRRTLGILSGVSLASLTVLIGSTYLDNNLHAIKQGEAYRSAQPDPVELADYRSRLGIRSIINLRGAEPSNPWYREEVATANSLGVEVLDFKMDSQEELSPENVVRLIALMREAPKPVLIHCRSGADRTGLAAALYLAAVTGAGEEAAEGQLSLRFGHFPIPVIGTYAMDASFEAVEPMLGFEDS